MSEFNHVTIIREANIYFDGKVTSRTVIFEDGTTKTLGIMMPGEYTFTTDKAELMEILAGKLSYKIAGTENWVEVETGASFNVPAKSYFDLKVTEQVDYCCSYLDS